MSNFKQKQKKLFIGMVCWGLFSALCFAGFVGVVVHSLQTADYEKIARDAGELVSEFNEGVENGTE